MYPGTTPVFLVTAYGSPENTWEKLSWIFRNPASCALYCILLGGLILYYIWLIRKGRTTPREVFVPVFRPPFGMSPAAVRYVYAMGFDTKCLVAAIMNAGLKGFYHIRWAKKGLAAFAAPNADRKRLSRDEHAAFLISREQYRQKIFFSSRISAQNFKMGMRLDRYLNHHYGKLIDRKLAWFWGSVAATALLSFGIVALSGGQETFSMYLLYFLISATCIIFPFVLLGISIGDRYVFGTVICAVYLAGGMMGLITIELHYGTPFYFPVMLPLFLIHYFGYRHLASPTPQGQRVLDEIMAYRKYLATQFSTLNSREDLDEEKLKALPYVVALDLEARFTPYFNELLSRSEYSPYRFFEQNQMG